MKPGGVLWPSANTYGFQGPQLTVGYGTGVAAGFGFFYQDAHQTLRLPDDQVRTAQTEIGLLVTATIRKSELFLGWTSFTLLIPSVDLGGTFGPVAIQSLGVTTVHVPHVFINDSNQQQTELYTVTPLTGTARFVPL